MTAPALRLTTAVLCRAGGVAAILAIVAGILGMHALTGGHSMHSPAAMTAAAAGHAASSVESHTGHQDAGTAAALPATVQDAGGCPAEVCLGNRTGMQTMTVSCTPFAKTGSLAAPPPGTAGFGVVPGSRAAFAPPPSYAYLPGSPSPGELSISRT